MNGKQAKKLRRIVAQFSATSNGEMPERKLLENVKARKTMEVDDPTVLAEVDPATGTYTEAGKRTVVIAAGTVSHDPRTQRSLYQRLKQGGQHGAR